MDHDDSARPCCRPAGPGRGEPDQALSRTFKAMGDPTRLAILAMLRDCDGSLCACDIEESFDLSQPTISHHLRQLRQAGLVVCERRASWMHYRLEPTSAAAIEDFARGLASRRPVAP